MSQNIEPCSSEHLALRHANDDTLTKIQQHSQIIKEITGESIDKDITMLNAVVMATEDNELKYKCISKKIDAKLKLFEALTKEIPKETPMVQINNTTSTTTEGLSFDLDNA